MMSRILTAAAVAFISCVGAIGATFFIVDFTEASGSQSPISGDPALYQQLASEIADGGIPYVDVTVEHLPIALVPMVGVELTTRNNGLSYGAVWALLMSLSFIASAVLWTTVRESWNPGIRLTLLALPLLPLVLFRVEPWVLLFVTLSIVLAFKDKWVSSTAAAVLATLAKGWPIALLAFPFRAGRKGLALAGVGLSVAAMALLSNLDGFRSGRDFSGIHTETLIGNGLMVIRHSVGQEPGVFGIAGAVYTDAAWNAVALNAAVGGAFIVIGIIAVSRNGRPRQLMVPVGLVVLGIMIASPLFSSQFLFWLVPFAMYLPLTARRVFIVASIATLVTVVWWYPEVPAWSAAVLTRNVSMLVLAVLWSREALWPKDRAGMAKDASQHPA